MVRRAARKAAKGGGPKAINAARGLWVGQQASVKRTRDLCNARTWWSRSQCRYMVRPGLGKVVEIYATRYFMTLPIVSYSPLGMTETLKMSLWGCGGGEEGGEGAGRSKGDKYSARAVGWAASVSEARARPV